MTLNEIVTQVVELTSRPDKIDMIRREVRAAILQVHSTASYPRDRVEEIFELNETALKVKLTLPPRFKKFELLGGVDAFGSPIRLTTTNNQYTRVDPSGIFENSLHDNTDFYYVAGAAFVISSSKPIDGVYTIYRVSPEVADNDLETWIMEEQPSLITDLALSRVYSPLGRNTLASAARNEFNIANQQFMFDNLVEGLN